MKPQVTEEDVTLPPSPLPHDWLMYFSPGLATRNQYMNYRVSNVYPLHGWLWGGGDWAPWRGLDAGRRLVQKDAKKITGTP